MLLLEDKEWSAWSDREIARKCAVSNNFVSSLRPSLSSDDSEKQHTYTDKHGTTTTMNTANIGKSKREPLENESPKAWHGEVGQERRKDEKGRPRNFAESPTKSRLGRQGVGIQYLPPP